MSETRRVYRFHPLERRGLVVGLDLPQLGTLASGVLLALVVLSGSADVDGLFAAATIVGSAAAVACWPVAGRTPVGWLPVAGGWLTRRIGPDRTAPAGASASPPGVRLIDAPRAPGDEPLGVVRDARVGTWAAVLPVTSRAFTLLDADDKRRRLSAWGAVLASMARSGSPIHRIQWIERTAPVDPTALADSPVLSPTCPVEP